MKFSIRDLLLVTVIVALVLGWWVDHRQKSAKARAVQNSLFLEEQSHRWLQARMEVDGYKFVTNENGLRTIQSPTQAPAPNPPKAAK